MQSRGCKKCAIYNVGCGLDRTERLTLLQVLLFKRKANIINLSKIIGEKNENRKQFRRNNSIRKNIF